MSTKEQRAEVFKAIDTVIQLTIKVERTYTDLLRTNDQEERRRDVFERRLQSAEARLARLIENL